MSVSMVTSFESAARAFAAQTARVQANAARAVGEAGFLLEAEIKRQLSQSSHRKGTPTPSAPGEPPSLVSGALRRSIQTEIHGTGLTVYAKIGPTIIYGRIQELGGQTGRGGATTLPARPYVAPALQQSKPALEALFVRAVRQAL